MNRNFLRGAIAAAALLACAAPALAHVTLEAPEAKVGTTYKAVLRLPHGCGALATHTVRVQIPEGFYSVKPMPKAGWTLTTVIGPYKTPYDNHGTIMTEGVREIIWAGGNLPNEWYDEFVFRGSFGGDLASDSLVWFPTVQECDGGEEAWIDTTGAKGVAFPAPRLMLRAK
jgi:hypothetical protein